MLSRVRDKAREWEPQGADHCRDEGAWPSGDRIFSWAEASALPGARWVEPRCRRQAAAHDALRQHAREAGPIVITGAHAFRTREVGVRFPVGPRRKRECMRKWPRLLTDRMFAYEANDEGANPSGAAGLPLSHINGSCSASKHAVKSGNPRPRARSTTGVQRLCKPKVAGSNPAVSTAP